MALVRTLRALGRGSLKSMTPPTLEDLAAAGIRCFKSAAAPVEEKGSVFIAHRALGVRSKEDVRKVCGFVDATIEAGAVHPIMCAYLLPDGTLGSADDGEKRAGATILSAMRAHPAARPQAGDVVVVSRWYDGTLLGPRRFGCITECVRGCLDTPVPDDDVE